MDLLTVFKQDRPKELACLGGIHAHLRILPLELPGLQEASLL
jgi:hypothetical protein